MEQADVHMRPEVAFGFWRGALGFVLACATRAAQGCIARGAAQTQHGRYARALRCACSAASSRSAGFNQKLSDLTDSFVHTQPRQAHRRRRRRRRRRQSKRSKRRRVASRSRARRGTLRPRQRRSRRRSRTTRGPRRRRAQRLPSVRSARRAALRAKRAATRPPVPSAFIAAPRSARAWQLSRTAART